MKRRGLVFLAAGAAVALALAGAALATLTAGSSAAATTVKVTEREYRITLSVHTLHAGKVSFVVHNAGRISHELALSGPGLRTMKTPLIRAGGTRTLTVRLGGGTFRLWCPVPGHAADGMKASFRVLGAPGPVVTNPPTTTDDGYGYGGGGGY
jgi:uncharacterized cupredoxin-like copper-binding protein